MQPFCQYRANGTLWKAGHSVWGLCLTMLALSYFDVFTR